jgi:hypothetical protein
MTRPNIYKETSVLNEDTAYGNVGLAEEGLQSSDGSLQRGLVVWLEKDTLLELSFTSASAYTEGIGVVRVSTKSLDRARLLRDRASLLLPLDRQRPRKLDS